MSKLLFPILGIGGAGAVGVGGYVLFKGNESTKNSAKQEETFGSRYSQALLEEGSGLWNTKFSSLQNDGNPVHPTLKNAKTVISAEGNNQQDKELHKQGCKEIYGSSLTNNSYFNDFKSYCSKNLRDEIGDSRTWISEGESDTSKWNPKLTSLSTHDESKNQTLSSILRDLKGKLTGEATSWGNEKRKILKDWCDSSQKEIFMGTADPRFIHASLYCVE